MTIVTFPLLQISSDLVLKKTSLWANPLGVSQGLTTLSFLLSCTDTQRYDVKRAKTVV